MVIGVPPVDILFTYLIPLGAMVAAGVAVVGWGKGYSLRLVGVMVGCWVGPWILLALMGFEGVEWMFQIIARPSDWVDVGPVWLSPYLGAAILVLVFARWKRGIPSGSPKTP